MERFANALLTTGSLIFGASLLFNQCTYTIDAGQRGIINNKLGKGLQEKIYGEGMHFYIPFVQEPIIFEIRLTPKQIISQTGTKDLQTVDVILRVLHRPIPEKLPAICNTIGKNYEEKILPSIGNEVLKSVIAQYDVDQLLKKREHISNEIKEGLIERAKDFNIILEDVSIVHIGFMREYAQAIEHKQVAQQLAERQRFVVMKDEEEKNAQIIRSEGEAEAAKYINEAVAKFGNSYIDLKRLEAAKYVAEVLAKNPNVTFVPSGSNGVLLNMRG